ncbi:alpha/beta fold hydrolase [Aestuariibius sp. 2305UL40-4]|uniref:alpha/beta fold hydrolase n=1 Tax=Aestuariibius violaceus TaxID=3234132 RepID=UPI00345E6A08
MTLINISAEDGKPGDAARAASAEGPVIVMIHGFKYAPGHPHSCPHDLLLSLDPRTGAERVVSWPRRLGFGRPGDAGTAVAFGWNGRGTLGQAYLRAGVAGERLAAEIAALKEAQPERPVHIFAHSLGARVALSALGHLNRGAVDRMILLTGAEFRDRAAEALETPAGRSAEVFNVTSRENDLFDLMAERVLSPLNIWRRTLGHGLAEERPNWVDIEIDHPGTAAALRDFGYPIAPPAQRICHWSVYLRPGLFPFYQALLRRPEQLPLRVLRAALPGAQQRRWTRLLAPPAPLPFARKTPS